jgi:hypothetical protein
MKKPIVFFLWLSLIGCSIPQKNSNQQATKEKRIADSIAAIDKKRLEAEELEKQRVLKESSLGIWRIGYYVDEFGEPTKDAFIGTNSLISGTFSNSATENSDLTVKLLISNPQDVSIQLFEYAGNNPIKAVIDRGYKIKVKQDTLPPVNLYASNSSDRLSLNKNDSKKLNNLLLKGGYFKFFIVEVSEYSKSSYYFEIPDASGYNNAIKQLTAKK